MVQFDLSGISPNTVTAHTQESSTAKVPLSGSSRDAMDGLALKEDSSGFKTPSPPKSSGKGHSRSLSAKLRDFFGRSRPPTPQAPSSSGSEDGSIRHPKPDSEHFEILSTQVDHIDCPEDVCFKQKYRFVNGQIVGKGASGVVRLCTRLDDSSHGILAVKEFRRRRRTEPYHDYLRKITSEYCIAHTMKHPNVVETIDIMHGDDRWYEVMEYCSGGDLYAAIHSGQQSRSEILCFFKQLVRGVHYLHSMGVVHRDLKPDNLLIQTNGCLKITDFGVAAVFHLQWETDIHKLRGICGSSPYIAPEEWNGVEYDAEAIDVWSIGIILYAMLFRSVPWEVARCSDPLFEKYSTAHSLPTVDAIDPDLKAMVYQLLEVDPAKRVKLTELMKQPLFGNIHCCIDHDDKSQLTTHSHDILYYPTNSHSH